MAAERAFRWGRGKGPGSSTDLGVVGKSEHNTPRAFRLRPLVCEIFRVPYSVHFAADIDAPADLLLRALEVLLEIAASMESISGTSAFWSEAHSANADAGNPGSSRDGGDVGNVRVLSRIGGVLPSQEASSASAQRPAGRRGRLCACAAPGPYPSRVRCSTDQEEWLPRGHRSRTDFSRGSENQPVARFVRDREWCPDAFTNSLCVNRVRVSRMLNTAESLPRW